MFNWAHRLFNYTIKKHYFSFAMHGSSVILSIIVGLTVFSNNLSAQTLGKITVSVDESQTDIIEGERAQFILTNDAATLSPLTVNISVTEVGDFIIGSAPTFWPFSGNARSETFLIPTQDDADDEPELGKIQVRVKSGIGYTFSAENVAEIKVRDNDSTPHYQITTPQGDYNEGASIPVSIYSNSVSSTDQTVDVTLQQNGNFIDSNNAEFRSKFPNYSTLNQAIQLLMPAGQFAISFEIPTINNDTVDSDGFISANIINQNNVQGLSEQVTIDILDDDNFVVSISATTTTITEGEPANFTLISSRVADQIREINLNVSETNDFIDGQVPNSVSMLAGTTSKTFSLRTDDDRANDQDSGTISVELMAGVGYSVSTSDNSIGFTVNDNDPLPIVEIGALLATSQEGSRAFFNLQSDRIASFSYNITLRFTQIGNFFQNIPNGTQIPNTANDWQIIMGAGNNRAQAYVHLLDNDIYESDGSITATLLAGDNYVIHGTQNEETVTIINNDSIPVVSVSGSIASGFTVPTVNEGETATFTFNLDKSSITPITVNIRMSDSGNFTLSAFTTTIQIPADSTTQTFEVVIMDDNIANNGDESWLATTIVAGAGYEFARNPSVRINIIDNEPIMSIVASTASIVEGGDAIFNINTTATLETEQTIQVKVSQTGDFLTNGAETATTRLRANETQATLSLSTENDNEDELTGTIRAQLMTHSNLIVSSDSSLSSAEMAVNDNDIPVLSLADPTPVIEGQDLAVTFIASSAPAVDTLVHISVIGTGDVIAGFVPTIFFFQAGQTTDTLNIQTRIDSRDIPDRTISVTINADSFQSGADPDYTVDPSDNSKNYNIADLEFPYISILSPRLSWATEGTIFQFELFASSPPVFDLIINLSVQEYADAESDPRPLARSYNYLSDPTENQTVILEAGKTSTHFAVATVDDYVTVTNSQIIVTIRSGDRYQVFPAPSNRARAVVQNNDFGYIEVSPLLTVSASQSSYEEGMPVTIIIESTSPVLSTQTVFLNLSEQFGDNVIVGDKQYTVEIDAGSTRKTVTFQTREDYRSGDRIISAALEPYRGSRGYLISNTNGRVYIPIRGIEPVVSISAVSPTVEEGGVAEFELSLQPSYKYDVPIALNISGDSGLINAEFSSTTVVPANQTTLKFEVPIADNQGVDPDRLLTVTLDEVVVGETLYTVADLSDSAVVTVVDNEPILSLFALEQGPISEGEIAKFVVVTDRPLQWDKTITYEIIENGEYTTQTDNSILLRAGESSAKIDITSINDSIGEVNGRIGLRISDNKTGGYSVDSAYTTATVAVLDNDEPVISINSNHEFVIEGTDTGRFAIYSSNPLQQDIAINLRINASQNVIDYSRMIIDNSGLSLNSGTLDGILSIPVLTSGGTPTWVSATTPIYTMQLFTNDDLLVSTNETVRVEILTGNGYKLNESLATSSIEVIDNDEFEISLTRLTTKVTEGSIAEFELTSNQTVTSNLTINLEVTFVGDFFNRVSGPDSEQITIGQTTQLYRVGTQIDNQYENNGSVTVMLRPGPGYYPDLNAQSSTIIIEDDDEPPGFSILANSVSIIEGEEANFTIKTSQSIQTKQTIEVTLSDGAEDYLSVGPIFLVDIDAGATIGILQVKTTDDEIYENDGTIYARISDSNVNISPQNSVASIIAQDNDSPPVIAIRRKSTSNSQITEGENATFTLEASRVSGFDQSIIVEATETNSNWLNEVSDVNGKYFKTVILPAGSTDVDIDFRTEGDRVDEPNGRIIAWIRAGTDYTISPSQGSAWVAVVDDDAPVTFVITRTSASSVSEGSPIEFVINAFQSDANTYLNPTQIGLARDLPINIEVRDNPNSGNGRFLAHPVNSVVTINKGADSVVYSIGTDDDLVDEENGEIILSILPGNDYTLGKTHSVDSLSVAVSDNDAPPLIRFRHYGYTFVEGNEVFFEFEPDWPSAHDITINFFVQDETRELLSYFLDPNLLDKSHQVILPAMENTVRYSLTTLTDDNIDVIDRIVNSCTIKLYVRIIAGTNYANVDPGPSAQIGISQERNKITNCIYDNDGLPEVAVRVDQTNGDLKRDPITNNLLNEIDEGGVAKFELTTSIQAADDRMVNIIVDTSAGDFITGPIPSVVMIPKHSTRATIPTIQTTNDDVFEADNSITISVAEDTKTIPVYTVDPTGSRATIIVHDNDPTDGLRIIATDSSFSEGEFAEFQIAVNIAPTSTREFNLLISSTGNFIQDTGANIEVSRTAYLLPNNTRVTFRELVVQDNNDEPNATLTARLTGESTCTDINGVFKPQCTSTVDVLDDDNIPSISVTAGANVVEGEDAIFSLSSVSTISEDTRITIMYFDPSSFIDTADSAWQTGLGENYTKIVNLPSNQNRVNLFIPTIDDENYELDDTITVKILSDPAEVDKYTINPKLSSTAQVTIYDDDVPSISLVADSTSITEGDTVAITLVPSAPILTNITVWISVIEDNGDFIHGVIDDTPKTIAPNSTAQRLIETHDDKVDEVDGSFTVRVLEDPLFLDRYLGFDETNNLDGEITISVADNDQPFITISAVEETITEGDMAKFTLTADQPTANQLEINIRMTEENGNFLPSQIPTSQRMIVQETMVFLDVNTENDDIDEINGLIKVELESGENYSIPVNTAPGKYAIVNIQDNESSELTLSANRSSVVEGTVVIFILTATPAPAEAIKVQFAVDENGYDFIQGTTVPVELTLAAGVESIFRPVTTHDDEVNEADGSITARVSHVTENSGSYSIPADGSSSTVIVTDNDSPEISISTQLDSIEEGQNAEFTLHASAIPYFNLSINILVDQGNSDFLQSTIYTPIDFGLGLTEIPLEIGTVNDFEDELDGQITVEIISGTNYQVAQSPNNIRTIAITDNDLPEVTITTTKSSIVEGEVTTFTLVSTTPTPSPIMVNLNVAESGSFISGAKPSSELIQANASTSDLKISTTNDDIVELNGRITVTVLAGTGYTTRSPTNREFVNVADNDIELSLVQFATTSVIEGEDIVFEIRSSQAIVTPKTVNILISEIGSYLQFPKPTTHQLTNSPTSRYLTLSTVDDLVDESNGAISIQLLDGPDYTLGSIVNQSVNVSDNDVSEISIASGASSVFEGDIIEFKVTGNLERTKAIEIKVEISQVGDFLVNSPGIRTIILEAGKYTVAGKLLESTQRISGDDLPGSITGKLVTNSLSEYQIKGSHEQVTVAVTENSSPIIFINAGANVVESGVAKFTVYADIARNNPIQILYTVDDGAGNYLASNQPTSDFITLPVGAGGEQGVTTTINIQLHDDEVDEMNGVVTVTLQDDSNNPVQYRPSSTGGQASVNVNDNDQPEISIFAGNSISEGDDAIFTLSANFAPASELTIKILLADEGEFLNENSPTKEVSFPVNAPNQTVVFSVKTRRKVQATNQTGSIIATLETGLDYIISNINNRAVVKVNEPEVLSVTITSGKRLNEGEVANFRFGVSESITSTILINIAVSDPGNYILGQVNSTHSLSADPNSLALNLPTRDDQVRASNNTITIKILEGIGYRVGNPDSAQIHVIDNDSLSISVQALEVSVIEGELARFRFTSNLVAEEVANLNFEVRNGEGDFIAQSFFENIPEISFSIGSSEELLEVPTVDDSINEENGEVEVKLLAGVNYAVDPTSQLAAIEIHDNDTSLISITAISQFVDEGSIASFQIVASNEASVNRQIFIEIDDPYNTVVGERPDTIMLEEFQLQTLLQLGTVDNDRVDPDNVITVTLMSNERYQVDDSARIAKVNIMDNDTDWNEITQTRLNTLNLSVMPSMLRAKQSNNINLLSSRIEHAFEVIQDPTFKLNNQQTLPEILTFSGNTINEQEINPAEILANSSFSVTTFPGPNESNPATLWASIGDYRALKAGGNEDFVKWEGDVFGGQLGFDSYFNEKILLGLGISYFQGNADYWGDDKFGYFKGTHQNWSMGFQPFVAYRPYGGESNWWATAGFGQGELKIAHKDLSEQVSFTQHFNTAIGGRYRLFSHNSLQGNEKAELSIHGEAWTAQELIGGKTYYFEEKVVDVGRAKVQFEGSLWQESETEVTKKPTFNLGVLWDWGDGETGFGIETGAGIFIEGIKFLTLELKGGLSLFHGDSLQEWYAQGLLRLDRYRDGLGLQVSTDATLGEVQANLLVDDNEVNIWKQGLDIQQQPENFQFASEIGYGFNLSTSSSSTFMPYFGYEFHQEVINAFKFGGRLKFGTNFQLGLEGRREEQLDGGVSYGAALHTTFKW